MSEEIRVTRGDSIRLTKVIGSLKAEDAIIKSGSEDGVVIIEGSTSCRGDCVFECTLQTENLESRGGRLSVHGDLLVSKIIEIKNGDLYVKGRLSSERLSVDRNVEVGGVLESKEIDVGGTLEASGFIKAKSLDLGGKLYAGSNAEIKQIDVGGVVVVEGDTKSESIEVGGKFVGKGRVEAYQIDVGGSVEISSEADIDKIDVGGSVKLAGGIIHDKIDVGGSFESSKPLKFKIIEVGGKATIVGGEGTNVYIGGLFKSEGDLTFRDIRVGGKVEITGDASGENIEVGGSLEVSKSLSLSGRLIIGGRANIGGQLRAMSIRVGARLEAEKIEASIIQTNKLLTRLGAKAKNIEIGRRGEVRGPLIAEKVVIKDRSVVEDIYADLVKLGRECTARNIYASHITLELGCRIEGFIKYTQTLKTDKYVRFASEPIKTDNPPTPPF